MRFKLLHVMPHVWIHKHKEPVSKPSSSSSPNTDDNGDHAPVFKRSTALKLVKSSGSSASDTNKSTKVTKSGKQVQVCTVVDAGCTCRATMTSQHKQKKNQGVSSSENKVVSSSSAKGPKSVLSSSCKPKTVEGSDSFFQATEPELQWRLRNAGLEEKKSRKSKKKSPYSSASAMSSSLSSSINTNTVSTDTSEADELVLDARSSNNTNSPNAVVTDILQTKPRRGDLFGRDDGENMTPLPSLQELMEEYVASKTNVKHVDMESLYHHSSGRASFAGFHRNQQLEVEDCFNRVKSISGRGRRSTTSAMVNDNYNMIGKEEIVSSDSVDLDRMITKVRDNAAKVRKEEISDAIELERRHLHDVSDASELDRRVMKMYRGSATKNAAKPSRKQEILEETPEFEERHDVIEFDDRPRKLLVNNDSLGRHWPSENDDNCDGIGLERGAMNNDIPARHWPSMSENDSDVIELERRVTKVSMHLDDTAETAESSSGESGSEGQVEVVLTRFGQRLNSGDDEDGSQAPPFTASYSSSSISTSNSCEINVPKDCAYYNGKEEDGIDDHNENNDYRNVCSSPSTSTAMSVTSGHDGEMDRKYNGAVAMVKSSFDPHHDFKKSMAEMVVAKRLRGHGQLQQLLQCYLSLNPHQYHATIVEAFHELCSDLLTH